MISFFYIAAFASPDDTRWFSPGRYRKTRQVLAMLSQADYDLIRINTAPTSDDIDITTFNLYHSSQPIIRLIYLVCQSFLYFWTQRSQVKSSFVMVYNTRTFESIVSLIAILLLPRCRLILQLEDLPQARRENNGLPGVLDLLFLKTLSNYNPIVYAASSSIASHYSNITDLPVHDITLLPPSLDQYFLDAVASREAPFSSSRINILYTGSFISEKGVEDLLSAFLNIADPIFSLSLVGPAPCEIVNSFKSHPSIQFHGFLDDKLLTDLICSSDVFVNPHRHTTNEDYIFPFKLIELVASGCLPLTTPFSGGSSLGLPNACLFSNSIQLTHKLKYSRILWDNLHDHVLEVSHHIRQTYSSASIQKDLLNSLIITP